MREHYLQTTQTQKTSDPKVLEYNARMKKRGFAPNPDCSVCHGAGFLHPLGESGLPVYKAIIPCDAPGCLLDSKSARDRSVAAMEKRGVDHKLLTFENFDKVDGSEKAFDAFYLVAHNLLPPFLLCYGGTGNGKSHLCQAAARVLNQKGVAAKYFLVFDLMMLLKNSIQDNNTEALVTSLESLPALILDDWGVNYGTDWEMSKLEGIIGHRFRVELVTILTSNLDFSQLEKMSPRITSRFRDKELAQLVLNKAPDYRPKKEKKSNAAKKC